MYTSRSLQLAHPIIVEGRNNSPDMLEWLDDPAQAFSDSPLLFVEIRTLGGFR